MDKICTACKQSKPVDQFGKNKIFKDGLNIYCKECRRSMANIRYQTLSDSQKEEYHQKKKDRYTPEQLKVLRRKYYIKKHPVPSPRYASNTQRRIVHSLRSRIGQAVRGYRKAYHTWELIGCTPDELCKHLSNKFTEGMSWENYGQKGWHIDHVIPCASFDLSTPDEQRKCCHYSNLQPLWEVDNLRKGSKLPPIAAL